MISRAVHDVSVRVVYPFLPEVSAGLRVPLDRVGQMLSLRSGVEIVSPLAGALSDRLGHRRSMSIALVVLAIGLAMIGLSSDPAVTVLGFVVSGVGTAFYLPSQLAYVSERTPYARRGRVLGAIEMTWASAGIVGAPLMGALIGSLGWRAPFIAVTVSALVCAALTLTLAETPPSLRARGEAFRVRSILHHCSAIAFLVVWLLLFLAFENIQVGYASWFESRFGLSAGQRGFMQTLFGVFEIAASSSSSLFLDRVGKKRGVTSGLLVGLLGYVMLVGLGHLALWIGLASMSIAFLGFEFSVVSGLSIGSEQLPQARGTMLALVIMSSGLGRMFGAVSGGAFAAGAGFPAAALASAAIGVVTLGLFVGYVQERERPADLSR